MNLRKNIKTKILKHNKIDLNSIENSQDVYVALDLLMSRYLSNVGVELESEFDDCDIDHLINQNHYAECEGTRNKILEVFWQDSCFDEEESALKNHVNKQYAR